MNRFELKAVQTCAGLNGKDFAGELGITPRYLRSFLSGKEARTLSEHVTAKVILFAKRVNKFIHLDNESKEDIEDAGAMNIISVLLHYDTFADYKVDANDKEGDEKLAWQAVSMFYTASLARHGEGKVFIVPFDMGSYVEFCANMGTGDNRMARGSWAAVNH